MSVESLIKLMEQNDEHLRNAMLDRQLADDSENNDSQALAEVVANLADKKKVKTDANPYHEPAGSEKGGQFAHKEGNSTDPEDDPLYKIQHAVVRAALDQGYPVDKLVVETEPERFSVGDKNYLTGGKAYIYDNGKYPKGTIAIYASGVTTENVPAIMAHEIMHHKFEQVLDQKSKEFEEIDKVGFARALKPDGMPRDVYKGRWPAYEAITSKFDDKLTRLKKEDGVSDYSRAYWEAYNQKPPQVTGFSAVHETLAEMAKNEYFSKGEKRFINPELDDSYSATGGSKAWRALYAAINRVHKGLKQ